MLSLSRRFGLRRRLLGFALGLDESDDPWHCMECEIPARFFAPGSIHDFPWYFEGESSVPVSSFEDVCSFLLGCEYVLDSRLFRVDDFWQHPITFEHLRRGDCEDHALWAWRKLRELGYRAHLVSGSSSRDEAEPGGHAWVIFHAEDGIYLLEATAKARERMVLPLDSMRRLYQPYLSVDESFTVFVYAGYMQFLKSRGDAKRHPSPPGIRA